MELTRTLNINEILNFFSKEGDFIVFWDAENQFVYNQVKLFFSKMITPDRIFSLSSHSFVKTRNIARYPLIGNHLNRNSNPLTLAVYANLVEGFLKHQVFGLETYFPEGTEVRTVSIKRTRHKFAAIEAIQKVVNGKGMPKRLAAKVAQSVDELILNAILRAPRDPVEVYNMKQERMEANLDFELKGKEQIEIRMANTEDYMGVSIKDYFGTFTRKALCESFALTPGKGGSERIGLPHIAQGGMSLLIVSQPGVFTEVSIFFRLVESVRDFKNDSFHFFCSLLPSS